jgi:hypothetical protein
VSEANVTEEAVPSQRRDLLAALVGARIERLTRYSWEDPDATGSPLPPFSSAAGPLLIALDSGEILGAASQPSLMSVTLWLERDRKGGGAARTLGDPELHPIEATDPQLSTPELAALVGRRIESMALLRRDAEKVRWQDRPREVGLVLRTEGGGELILAHGLHDDSDDFSVLLRSQVKPSLWVHLHETPL